MTEYLLDISNYDVPFSDNTVECLEESFGYKYYIVGSQRPGIALDQIRTIQRMGARVQGTYAFLYFGLDTLGQTANAINLAKDAQASYVWLDCESVPPHEAQGITASQRIAELHKNVQLVTAAGLNPGIYTGQWWWVPNMGNTTAFSELPLWHSAYWDDEREVRHVNYGGWKDVSIHQFSSSLTMCGRPRDRNYVFNTTLIGDDDLAAQELFNEMNAALQKRMAIETLANNPDLPTVEAAYALLKSNGFVK